MNYKELLEKNARIRAQRELARIIKKVEPKPAPIIEETPHVCECVESVEEIVIEDKGETVEELVDVAVEEEAPKKKRKPSKPKNREYMVVENIEEVNKEE